MADSLLSWAIALDGGTTNTRARLVDVAAGRVVATARRGVGVRDAVVAGRERGPERPLERALREAIDELGSVAPGVRPDALVAAGMLTSEVGLAAVPHVDAPAGLDELAAAAVARALPALSDLPVLFVPGVRTPPGPGPDGWASADVMRGEECETLGGWLRLAEVRSGRAAFLWPGSHTKLVEVGPDGRIVRSQTTLAGELMQALARHTLMAASLPEKLPDDPDDEAVEAGARLVAREGLGRAAFLVRVAALTAALEPERRAAFWVGAVVADDVLHLATHPILSGNIPAWVGGRQPLRRLYARQLRARHPGPVRELDDATSEVASAIGALAVARRSLEAGGAGMTGIAGVTG